MLNLLNNNIIQYVLNEYLDYIEDGSKLKMLFPQNSYKFNIKKHLIYKKISGNNFDIFKVFCDNKIIKETCFKNKVLYYRINNISKIFEYLNSVEKELRCLINLPRFQVINYCFNKNNCKDGIYIFYYNNGKIYEKFYIKDKELNGPFILFYQNGVISESKSYKNGFLHGIATTYSEEGDILTKNKFINGKRKN
jgi:antitoxin component YwqK of YwqJK toxin-antitoxin module